MKKKNLKKLALFGIAGGVIVSSQGNVQAGQDINSDAFAGLLAAGCGAHGCNHTPPSGSGSRGMVAITDDGAQQDGQDYSSSGQLMTEDQLMSQLNDQGKQMYNSLSPEGKALAIKLASRSCKGTNDCKGLGACKTNEHSCAGKNSCAGTSKCSFKDKNLAVKVAAQKMSEKRSQTNSGSY